MVAEELEAVLDMNNPRFLRMQLHSQLFQDSASRFHRGSCLCCRFTGDHPGSSPVEFHPEALSELYVSLSIVSATYVTKWAHGFAVAGLL